MAALMKPGKSYACLETFVLGSDLVAVQMELVDGDMLPTAKVVLHLRNGKEIVAWRKTCLEDEDPTALNALKSEALDVAARYAVGMHHIA
jgi:hypothetical protein